MAAKKRLDCLLVDNALEQSRERARAIIMSGNVYVNGQKAEKPGMLYDETSKIEIRGATLKYVSRGGLKLEKAISVFNIDLAGVVAMDIGASTGGFSDCMLQNGAAKVYCVDVGYGQLAWKLRTDDRIVNMERTNIRYVTPEQIGEYLDFISIDVSFISLKLVLPVAFSLLKESGECVALIKPQFEAGRENIGKKGVVRDRNVHFEVIEKCIAFTQEIGFNIINLTHSPVKGPEGNIEYLMHIRKDSNNSVTLDVNHIIEESYHELKGCGDVIE